MPRRMRAGTVKESNTMSDRSELLRATDAEIEDAVKWADPMVLRGLLYQLTGDIGLKQVKTAPLEMGPMTLVSLAEDDAAAVQRKMADFLKGYRDAGAPPVDLDQERLHVALELTAGEDIADSEYEMWFEQTALDPFARTFAWAEKPDPGQLKGFTVAVVGAGLGGLATALSLKRAGIDYFLLEKNPDVGGTWYENRYPGARVDSPSRIYSHIFGADYTFPYQFSPRNENLNYINWVADRFGLRDNATFQTEVTSMVWDEHDKMWTLTAKTPDGTKQWRANAVITSVGFLSRPNLPDIEGMDSFQGVSTHTARWPEGLDHAGKRIALIGSGASGYQLAPELARTAERLTIFQRTPSWCTDMPAYLDPLPEHSGWLDRNLPFFRNFMRFRMSWFTSPDHVAQAMHVDPNFQDPHARSERNKRLRERYIAFIESKLGSRPDLVEKMIPNSPPLATRAVIVDQKYSIFDVLLQDNVELIDDPIARITPKGVQLANGREVEVDIIAYATGYKANEFLWPMELKGAGGKSVEELWAEDGARAYLTAMMPGFPNFFMIYGPNGNNFGGLQIIDFLELVIRFSVGCIAGLIAEGKKMVEVSEDAYRRYAAEVDRCEARMLYADHRVTTYYKNAFGRSAANNPIDIRRIWNWTRNPAPAVQGEAIGRDDVIRPHFGEDLMVS